MTFLSPRAQKAIESGEQRQQSRLLEGRRLYEKENYCIEREQPVLVDAVKTAALYEPGHIRAFVLGGVATFTIRSSKTGTRFTYRVTRARRKAQGEEERKRPYFVAVLHEPNNSDEYCYMGLLWEDSDGRHKYVHPKKSQIDYSAPSAQAFRAFWKRINYSKPLTYKDGSVIEFHHAGYCGRCGKLLTVPESITMGFGPVCITKVRKGEW